MRTLKLTKEQIFEMACELTDPVKQAQFLETACSDTPDIREEIMNLLPWDRNTDELLDVDVTAGDFSVSLELPELQPQIDNYRILRKAGEGGMGVVYLAEQLRPISRTVALKVIKPGLDSKQVLGRFASEQQILRVDEPPEYRTRLQQRRHLGVAAIFCNGIR